MFSIAATNTITIVVKWKSPLQWLFFAYSINLVIIYLSTVLLDGIAFLIKRKKNTNSID
jgi:hypothetical protein